MILKKRNRDFCSKGSKKVLALFDSGATYSIISKHIAENIEIFTLLPQPKNSKLVMGITSTITHRVLLDFKINGIILSDEFLVFEKLPEES